MGNTGTHYSFLCEVPLLLLFCFAYFVFIYIYFLLSCWGRLQEQRVDIKGQMSAIGVYDVKFTKNQ